MLFREVYLGSSVGRALMHVEVRETLEMRGVVLDIGGGRRRTYLGHARSEPRRVVTIDIEPGPDVNVVASATCMPLDRASVDTVLCFNVLEHIYDHRAALAEIARVLKRDGALHGWVPFIIGVHAAPNDYFRYTPSSLEQLLLESGLEPTRIACCGNVFLSAFDLVRPHLRGGFIGRLLRVYGLALALLAQLVYTGATRIVGESALDPAASPSGIWFSARPNTE
ncbi:MAG: SAM-dependent methyltransferase [Gammaproteobacteria bacterium]|nr:SAM-dependent methyltransferase [Gammaproteobacteria bacterium]